VVFFFFFYRKNKSFLKGHYRGQRRREMKSEFLQEMKEIESEIEQMDMEQDEKKSNILKFAQCMLDLTDGSGEITGLLTILEDLAAMMQISEIIGYDLFYKVRLGKVEGNDRADLLVRFAKRLQHYGDDDGKLPQAIKAQYEKALEDLEKSLPAPETVQ
jgi:hypothetical protein